MIYILLQGLLAKGQLATVRDPDGFTNVRAGSSIHAKIIGRLYDGDVFGYGRKENGWMKVYYWPSDSADSRGFEGHIYKDRLLSIYDLPHTPEIEKPARNGHVIVRNDSLVVEIRSTAFHPDQHKLRKDKFGNIQLIDGKRPLGTDGEMPLEQLTSLSMTIGGRPVDIPASAWDNLYDPTLETCGVFLDTRKGFLYVHLLSTRSAAGGYEMVWIFKNGRYLKRYVDQSNN